MLRLRSCKGFTLAAASEAYSVAAFLEAQSVKNLPAVQETWVRSLGLEDPLEKEMATYFSILAWKTSWTEEPSGLQSMGSQRVGHDWATNTYLLTYPVSHFSGFSCWVTQALGAQASVVGAPRLWTTVSIVVADRLSCSEECGLFPDQGSNPCLLHQQADSLPLSHQGSPWFLFLIQVHDSMNCI